jgi:hypothetical protein
LRSGGGRPTGSGASLWTSPTPTCRRNPAGSPTASRSGSSLERIASAELASERGVYRITAAHADGEQQVFYGQFHTFARKAGGRWRIVADYDSTEGGAVTEKTFAAATAAEDIGAFAG